MTILVTLFPHQAECRNWLVRKEQSQRGGVLALTMGLGECWKRYFVSEYLNEQIEGKTVIGLSLIGKEDPLPTLIFCPVGLLYQWKFEIEDKTDLQCTMYHGKNRKQLIDREKFNVVLASFGSAKDEYLQRRTWHRMIIDEIHYIRNIQTILFKSLNQYTSKYRIGLTGTPLVNGAFDLFSYCLFLKLLDLPYSASTKTMDRKLYRDLKKQFTFRLDRGLMQQTMFQMQIEDSSVDLRLTPYHEQLHELNLDPVELTMYKTLEKRVCKAAASHHEPNTDHMLLLSCIVLLRQSANSLYLVRQHLTANFDEAQLQYGSKLAKCIQLICDAPCTDKLIVFSEFLGMMQVVGQALTQREIPHLFYAGEMNIQDRSQCITNFQKHEGKIVLIAMKQCISVGLNLTQANHVIFLSEWWNFTLDKQCIARIHRLGQSKPVFVHKLMAKSTIDERIRQIAAKKETEIQSTYDTSKTADKYLRQTSLTDYGYLLNLS